MNKIQIYIYLIALSVSPVFALGEGGRNQILIAVMYLSPLVFITNASINLRHLLLLAFMVTTLLAPPIFHPESLRWSTVLYGEMFCCTYLAISSILAKSRFTPEAFLKILKYLMYAYCAILVIQQFCVLLNLPVFNLGNYNPKEPWKLNSLTSEPSHSVRYMALFMFCYLSVKELILDRKYLLSYDLKTDKWVWFTFLWVMVTSVSATAYVFILIVLMKFVDKKRLVPIALTFLLILGISSLVGITAFERAFALGEAVFTGDVMAMVKADHSGSARVAPMFICFHFIDLNTLDGWFGKGIDFVSSIMYIYFPGVEEGYTGGGILLVCVEYGFLAFLFYMIFSFLAVVRKDDYLTIILWALMCLIEGVNSQLTWSSIVFLWMTKYFISNRDYYNLKV